MASETMNEQALEMVTVHEGEVVNAPLSPEEVAEHNERIDRILVSMQSIAEISLDIWKDIQWIKDNRTYRDKYDDFDSFCREELGRDNSTIFRGLRDASFKEQLLLEASSDEERLSILSLKESNTRYIRRLPEEAQAAFWKLTFSLGTEILSKKNDGSIEPTTGFMEAIGSQMNEILEQGGLHIDGEFISVESVIESAKLEGVDEDSAKAILLRAGVSAEAYEALKRQAQHIRDKSMKADITSLKGTIEMQTDINGSDFPVLVDSKGNELDLCELLLSFNNRFVHLGIKAPIRE